ncbi:MAG: PQQ-binding-like beta-propeller repeat protein, partial [bacterium]
MSKRAILILNLGLILLGANIQRAVASDWPSWRGPHQNGVSDETGLVSTWSLDGTNLIWKAKFVGRSTPIVMNGKVYVIGRTGHGVDQQRVIACYDAKDGRLVWEKKDNVFHTTIPYNRVGWASLGGDPESGNVYAYGVDGLFTCYDGENGDILWQHSLVEEFHRFSGYGGRTNTPIVDEDLVHISFWTWSAWGEKGPPKPRFSAYDKRTGELVWTSYLKTPPKNTNYSNPVIAIINGVRTMVTGAPDGAIYGVKARTGEQLWKFQLSKGAIQPSVV